METNWNPYSFEIELGTVLGSELGSKLMEVPDSPLGLGSELGTVLESFWYSTRFQIGTELGASVGSSLGQSRT